MNPRGVKTLLGFIVWPVHWSRGGGDESLEGVDPLTIHRAGSTLVYTGRHES